MNRLTQAQQVEIENSLRELLAALLVCRNPLLDTTLQRWGPSRWGAPRRQSSKGDIDNRARVVVCLDREEGVLYLVARTAIHDHSTLRELVASFTGKGTADPTV
jgi:hypothetical protein